MSLLTLRLNRQRPVAPQSEGEPPGANPVSDSLIYAVGDIHGQCAMLQSLLEKIFSQPLRDRDTLVFVGDYIDRGPDSKGVIDVLLQLKVNHSNTVFLRGNHEQLMLDAANDPPPPAGQEDDPDAYAESTLIWLQNGGVETLQSYGVDFADWPRQLPGTHWQFLRDTQLEYTQGRYHFVHAGLIPPDAYWDSQGDRLDYRLWIREPFLSSRADFDGQIVVFGHTPQQTGRPLVQRNKIGLDTGAVFGGPLTCAILNPNTSRPMRPHFLHAPHIAFARTIPEE